MPTTFRPDPKSVSGATLHVEERTAILVIGAGRAGLTAAIEAAARGFAVVCVDENPVSFRTMGDEVPLHFGQGMAAASRNHNAMMEAVVASEPLIEQAFEAGVDLRLGTACWGLYGNAPGVGWLPGLVAGVEDGERSWTIGADHVVVATGRRDMGLAFPGWEKPGIMGATAAVSLATRYQALAPGRVLVLGSTAEALLDALTLYRAGVAVAGIVEQADVPQADAALAAAVEAAGIPLLTGQAVAEALGRDAVTGARLVAVDGEGRRTGAERTVDCDGIVLGVGTTPVVDLIDAAGARVVFQSERGGYAPVLGEGQSLSLPGLYAIGDCAGIWAEKSADPSVAEAEARTAIAAIAGETLPAAPPPAPGLDIGAYRLAWVRASVVEAGCDVTVCQCEEVTARELLEVRPPRYLDWQAERRNDRSLASLLGEGPPSPDQVKRLTRAGMGPCQGRRCREQVAALLALEAAQPLSAIPLAGYRAPVRPLSLALAGQLPESPEQGEHWDTWFGMHAQWRPFWEVPERYTVATNDTRGAVASE